MVNLKEKNNPFFTNHIKNQKTLCIVFDCLIKPDKWILTLINRHLPRQFAWKLHWFLLTESIKIRLTIFVIISLLACASESLKSFLGLRRVAVYGSIGVSLTQGFVITHEVIPSPEAIL